MSGYNCCLIINFCCYWTRRKNRKENSLWWSSFSGFFFLSSPKLFFFLIVKPFLRWNFNFKFRNALWLLSFHLSFLVLPPETSRVESETKYQWPDFSHCFLTVKEQQEILEAKQDIYYSIRFRFFQFPAGSGYCGERRLIRKLLRNVCILKTSRLKLT